MVGRQVTEQFHDVFSDFEPHPVEGLVQAGPLQHGLEEGMFFKCHLPAVAVSDRAKEQVLPHGRLDIVGTGFEEHDEVTELLSLEPLPERTAHRHDFAGEGFVLAWIDRRTDSQGKDVVTQLDNVQHGPDLGEKVVWPGRTRRLVVNPVAVQVVMRIAC